MIEPDAPQTLRAVGVEARGQVVDTHSQHEPRVAVGQPADGSAKPVPLLDRAARDVAGTHDQVVILSELQQAGERLGRVRKIAIHLDQRLESVLQPVLETGDVGGTQPQLALAFEQVNPVVLLHIFAYEAGGPVGRRVIDD